MLAGLDKGMDVPVSRRQAAGKLRQLVQILANVDIVESEIESKRNKINRLSFSCVDLYLCLLCTRKRRIIQNILIDEGIDLFTKKLDVINIFRQLMRIEKYEHLNNLLKPVEMSDECKLRLQKLNYPKNLGL